LVALVLGEAIFVNGMLVRMTASGKVA